MLFTGFLYGVHILLKMFISFLPTMDTPPTWLVSITSPIAYAWNMLDGFANASLLISFFGVAILIALAYQMFSFVYKTLFAVRGTPIDTSNS